MGTNYSVINDADGRSIVVINDIRFRGKRKINWNEVEEYLKQYIGSFMKLLTQRILFTLVRIFPMNSVDLTIQQDCKVH